MPPRLVLFGATGFTGALVAEYLAEWYGTSPTSGFTWGIAGRSRSKLSALASELRSKSERALKAGVDSMGHEIRGSRSAASCATAPAVYVCDVGDASSLDAMLSGAAVCITTVGPYTVHGTALVEACLRCRVHVCDLTGETPWVSTLVDSCDDRANKAGVKIVNCCGFDSVPSDLGALLLARRGIAEGDPVRNVRYYLGSTSGGVSGGTIASLMAILEAPSETRSRGIAPYCLVRDPTRTGGGDGRDQLGISRTRDLAAVGRGPWTIPFVMAAVNTRIVRRSHSLATVSPDGYGPRFSYSECVALRSLPKALVSWLALVAFFLLAATAPGRWLLRKVLPAPGQGPPREKMRRGHFSVDLVATTESGKTKRARVKGTLDPGYGMTARMISETAIAVMLGEKDDTCNRKGGVLTPATAVGSPLAQRLAAVGMSFELD